MNVVGVVMVLRWWWWWVCGSSSGGSSWVMVCVFCSGNSSGMWYIW